MLFWYQVSERGVIVFRAQDITPQQMKELALRITEAGGAVNLSKYPNNIPYLIFL